MPRVVLIAKSTYVWLSQLERRFGREVRRLDQIPDEALDELAAHGFNGLWLIGLWERSQASRRIKQRRGQADALASAYALYDYVVADDLGGEAALRDLEGRAASRGIRLAGDMVPNHVGIDGKWVAENPDWFIQLDHPPYPGYRFDGPDLSSNPAMAVMIEDHYWDDSDAAVVFKRVDRAGGEARYIYHGNDGTTMPWNDTAQLDYLKPEVREAVIQTILHVARTVPIIRFDAAMTLAKRHIQRLWYPPPGHGGAIPSRSAYGGMSAEAFERSMPVEFWREVVDRVAREAPGTLLLAEAFWMMEGYFVRTLGMHRVYNSAFMNMLKREENADYRLLMKNVLAFDPRILGRFVNFMNNPDEETAIAQFGDGDKYFGAAVMMATLPGLPMFGHGQVEGFREKYGMEYRAPTFDEEADERMVQRHRREIAPLLHRRSQFAPAETFRLYDVFGDDGSVREDVYAYSNRAAGGASLILFNNRYPRSDGTIHRSVPFAEPWSNGSMRDEAIHEALGIAGGEQRFTVLRERLAGLDYLHRSDDLIRQGLRFSLDGFQSRAFTEIREVRDEDGSYAGLHAQLAGAGVPDVDEARLDWSLRRPRAAFLALLAAARDGDDVAASALAFVAAAREHVEVAPVRQVLSGKTGRPPSSAGPTDGRAPDDELTQAASEAAAAEALRRALMGTASRGRRRRGRARPRARSAPPRHRALPAPAAREHRPAKDPPPRDPPSPSRARRRGAGSSAATWRLSRPPGRALPLRYARRWRWRRWTGASDSTRRCGYGAPWSVRWRTAAWPTPGRHRACRWCCFGWGPAGRLSMRRRCSATLPTTPWLRSSWTYTSTAASAGSVRNGIGFWSPARGASRPPPVSAWRTWRLCFTSSSTQSGAAATASTASTEGRRSSARGRPPVPDASGPGAARSMTGRTTSHRTAIDGRAPRTTDPGRLRAWRARSPTGLRARSARTAGGCGDG